MKKNLVKRQTNFHAIMLSSSFCKVSNYELFIYLLINVDMFISFLVRISMVKRDRS